MSDRPVQDLNALLAGLGARWLGPAPPGDPLSEITLDLAEVGPGVAFVARRNWYGDTHAQLAEAQARGAAALIVTRAEALPDPLTVPAAVLPAEDPALAVISARHYGHPTAALETLAVTGTNGKTSTTLVAEHLLRAAGRRPARMGTVDFSFEDQRIVASNTTPEALVVQRFAHDARALGATALVLEASSHGLALHRLAEVRFDAVGFTQLGRDHLDFHGDQAAYRAAKARLFTEHLQAALDAGKRPGAVAWVGPLAAGGAHPEAERPPPDPADPGAPTDEGRALLHLTPEGARRLAVGLPEALRALPAGWHRLSVEAEDRPGLSGQRCRLRLDGGPEHAVDLPLIGRHNLQNAAVALGLVVVNHPERFAAAVAALAEAPPAPGRLEPVGDGVFVDYAHTPDAVARLVRTAQSAPERPVRVVLGCGGDRDPGKRGPMARAAAEADHAWLTADNPRSEDPGAILQQMVAHLGPAERARITLEPDRARAIEAAIRAPGPAWVLILGKGHERTQTVGGRIHAFDDRQEARRGLRARQAGLDPRHAPLVWGFGPEDPADLDARLAWLLARPDAPLVLPEPPEQTSPDVLVGARAEILARLTPSHRRVSLTDGPPPQPPALSPPRLPSLIPRG